MKSKLVHPLALAVVIVSGLIWPGTAWPARRAQLVVDDDKVDCPNAGLLTYPRCDRRRLPWRRNSHLQRYLR